MNDAPPPITIRWRNGCAYFKDGTACHGLKVCKTDWSLLQSLAKTIYNGAYAEATKNAIIIHNDPFMLELILCIAALTAANNKPGDPDPQECAARLSHKPSLLYELARETGNYLATQPPHSQQATQTLQQLAKTLCKIINQQ